MAKQKSPSATQYWLVKTEPESYSVDDFLNEPKRTTCWDGVRNYQARNMLRDQMKIGDRVLIYHSNADPPAIAGIGVVVREGYPDHTAWNPDDSHYDPKSTPDEPRWFMVDIQLERKLKRPLPLPELRTVPALSEMELLRKGSRLSVQPVRPDEFSAVLALEDA
jgi:predicted RNA-binding protein with PUA-like domain